MRNVFLVLLVSMVASTCLADDLRGYIFLAIRDGKASGPVTDPVVTKMLAAKTGSQDKPTATVDVVGHYQDPSCKRVRVSISQSGVNTVEGRLITLPLPPFELNLCLNGRPPAETLATEAVRARQVELDRALGRPNQPANR